MDKTYNPQIYEDEIYQKWEKSGFFNPDNLPCGIRNATIQQGLLCEKNAPTYTIIFPPPNITAKLHIGHASVISIEDLMIRYHRMKGYRTLWLPGTDHAAIATQNVVEKKIFKEQGLTRHDLGKEKLLKEVWKFLKQTQATILHQTRKMGASLDWSREAFTFDDQRKKAVSQMFVDMYEAGVIYKGERIVNWCPRCHSTLADDEVEYKEQKAILYFFKYNKDFPFTIATTRPETKLGDTAVAVNLKDERYKKYIGKIYEIDFCGVSLKLKIIADREVDMNFGAGALGVTPAHSMIDWKMAEENDLEIKKVINEDGNIHQGFEKYSGKTAQEARKMIVKILKEQNLLEKEEEISNNLSICYRCGTVIEPLPSKQWFVAVDKKIKKLENKSLKEKAIEVVKKGEIKFIPERFEKRYLDWMENLHDWCISRQIWFGHEIPVWYKKTQKQKEIYVGVEAPEGDNWIQDPDTLDTWFSSGMWIFSTLGWPDTFQNGKKIGDLARFHPTQMLETCYEILTLWVSRMIMMSLFAVGEIPFEKVYLQGTILDKNGKKMSKSKGNGIDPIDIIEKFGADAVRLSMLMGSTPGNDSRMSEEKIAGYRNFVNKLWNISRYITHNVERITHNVKLNFEQNLSYKLTLADKWILNKFNVLIGDVTNDLEKYNFSQAGEKLREFTWNDFADWYLEVSKFEKNKEKNEILIYILENLLKLWHPFIPFITETIWSEMGNKQFLMIEKWPFYAKATESKPSYNFELIKEIIIAIRNARSENKIEPNKKIKAIICAGKYFDLVEENKELIKNLKTNINELETQKHKNTKTQKQKNQEFKSPLDKEPVPSLSREGLGDFKQENQLKHDNKMIRVVVDDDIEIYLIGAKDEEKEQMRINKRIIELEKLILNLEKKLSNKEFIKKAPANIVEKEKEKLKLCQVELKNLNPSSFGFSENNFKKMSK
ncbi:valine--tRNA ligase [Candidatus Kuenenbacteria bacterium]|nr:valine--tRNA ligase [Candidatus Kuenenbacteria bacterium]